MFANKLNMCIFAFVNTILKPNIMKKIFLVFALFIASMSGAMAFEFDGINLNDTYHKVSQEISKRGYVYDEQRNCLKGDCFGTEIYLSINYQDVSESGYVGQLIVEVPIKNARYAVDHMSALLNVIYHQISSADNTVTYNVDPDGTTMVLSQKGGSVFLTYNTPHYKPAK